MKSGWRLILSVALALVVSVAILAGSDPSFSAYEPQSDSTIEGQSSANLLVNGDMEQIPFYWKYPNHFIAGGWTRWWTEGTILPEYDDSRRRPIFEGEHTQVYFKWFGWNQYYEAGIYQVVENVTPCTPYRFTMWARNHGTSGVLPHAKIGLDPMGTQLTPSQDVGGVLALPATTVWSDEQTQLDVWEQLSVEAEAVTTRMTALTYATPDPQPVPSGMYFADTFWDAGVLAATTYPGNRLPAPDTSMPLIDVITSTGEGQLTLTWYTSAPASTSVIYTVQSAPFSPTVGFTHTTYLPWIVAPDRPPYVDLTPVQNHEYTITGLHDGDTVTFEVQSRYSDGTRCVTVTSGPRQVVVGAADKAAMGAASDNSFFDESTLLP